MQNVFSDLYNSIVKCQNPPHSVAESHHQDQCSNYFAWQEGIVDSGLAQSEKRSIWVALTEGEKNEKPHAEKPLTPHWFTSLGHLHSCHRCCLHQSLCVYCCAYGWCGKTQLAYCTLLGPSRSLLPATESQYEIWHHNGRMTKTISANSLNFANLYLLSNFLFSSISLEVSTQQCWHEWIALVMHLSLFFSLKDKLKQAGGHVHSGKQRIAAASRAWGINRYVDDLIVCITLCKKEKKKTTPKEYFF